MGLHIDRDFGESVTIVQPSGTELRIECVRGRLRCFEVVTKGVELLQWSQPVSFEDEIVVNSDITLKYLESNRNSRDVRLDITAPADVILMRTEDPRTVDDVLKQVMG